MRTVLLLGCFLVSLPSPALDVPHPATAGQSALGTATNEDLKARGLAGDGEAAHTLGDRYRSGEAGLEKDEVQAAKWYQIAADRGHAAAQADLGSYYLNGQAGLDQDDRKALQLFRAAAEHQHDYATHMVAWMHETGRGTPRDDAQAAAWYRKAADLGHVDSLAQLGWMTETGRGVPKDELAAAQMYAVAMRGGNAQATNNLGWLLVEGRGGLAKNHAAAKDLFELASSLGDARADGNLGYLHENGLGVPKNLSMAILKYTQSAGAGDLISQRHLGSLYLTGQAIGQDVGKAFHYLLLAAKQGEDRDCQALAWPMLFGKGIQQEDAESAVALMKSNHQAGRPHSRPLLALTQIFGIGQPPNLEEAKKLIREESATSSPSHLLVPILRNFAGGSAGPKDPEFALGVLQTLSEKDVPFAKLTLAKELLGQSGHALKRGIQLLAELSQAGDWNATFELGVLYQNGRGVPYSAGKALELFRKAAEGGLPEAMFHLGVLYQTGILVRKQPAEAVKWYLKAEATGWPPAKGRVSPDGKLAPLPK